MNARSSRRQASPRVAPLGIPPIFLLDALRRDRPERAGRGAAVHALLGEYLDAEGTSTAWGQIIETDGSPFRTWRIVPVALWEHTAQDSIGVPQDIPVRLACLAPQVRALLSRRLPRGVQLSGLQAQGRRHHFALFTLVLTDPAAEHRARRWISHRLVPELLPRLLAECASRLRSQPRGRRETSINRRAFGFSRPDASSGS